MNFDFARCPECGSYNLVFGDITWNDDAFEPQIQQEASCEDCGCEFLELHNTSYERTKITTPGTRERINSDDYKDADDEGENQDDDEGDNQDDAEIRADIMRLLGLEAK